MSTFHKVIPGRVVNDGIVSKENLPTPIAVISSPAHFPDFAAVTPRGPLKRDTVGMGDFTAKFGDTTDPFGAFYNPVTLAIQKLGPAGQASFSFKRLTNNTTMARNIVGVVLFEDQTVPNYKRDGRGGYVFDITGKPVPDPAAPTIDGVFACTGTMLVTADVEVGSARSFEVTAAAGLLVPENAKGTFFPLFEMYAGVGDAYNAMYATFGHSSNTDWGDVTRFIRETGAYPFTMNIGELLPNNMRVTANTINGSPDTSVTLYDAVDNNNLRYSLQSAIGAYTGKNVNRPVEEVAAPFHGSFVYTHNLNEVAAVLFDAEYTTGGKEPPVISTNRLPKQAIMNPLTFVDHQGNNYHHVVFGGIMDIAGKIKGSRVSLNHYLFATGGVFPYADKAGVFPVAPDTWDNDIDGPWVPNVGSPAVISRKQYWEMTQMFLQAYLVSYRSSLDIKDVIRNRSSFMWDVGYNEAVKSELIQFMAKRKDIIVVLCATEWLRKKTQDQIYSTMESLHTKIAMIPESETYQAQACRSSINLWDCMIINEPSWERFSLNLDLMYAFAYAGGGGDGKIYAERMPDHEGNRTLRIAHDPFVQFEADDPAANNLIQGAITVTPLNVSEFCRPALPTVFSQTDSVLKDLPNIWKCVVVEKILQDTWIRISGDSQISREGYISFVKDTAEARIRELVGSVLGSWEVDPSFREGIPNAKSVLYTVTRLWFNKAPYMMNSVLEAYNADTLTVE